MTHRWNKNVVAHPYALDDETIEELVGADFVFVAIDRGTAKRRIIERLEQLAIPFIDVGMGVAADESALGGLVRVTSSMPDRSMTDRDRVSLADPDPINDYRVNIQIADLNMLNAALAVIRWKKKFAFYRDLATEHNAIYVIDQNEIINEDVG